MFLLRYRVIFVESNQQNPAEVGAALCEWRAAAATAIQRICPFDKHQNNQLMMAGMFMRRILQEASGTSP